MLTQKRQFDDLIHLLLDMGETMLSCGAEVNRVEDTLKRIGYAYGVKSIDTFVITSSIIITMELNDQDHTMITQMRRISNSPATDYMILEHLNALSRRCCQEPIPLDELKNELIMQKSSSELAIAYAGSAIAVGSFTIFFGGSIADALTAVLFAILICFSQRKIAPRFPNTIMFNLFCSFFVGLGICFCVKFIPTLHLDKIMIGDIMLLIPGLALTNAIRDILMGDTISGLLRMCESILWAGALACGFIAAIWMMGV